MEYVAYYKALFADFFGSKGGGGRNTGGGMGYYFAPTPAGGVGGGDDGGFLSGISNLAGGIGAVINAVRGGNSVAMPGGYGGLQLGNYGGIFPNAIGAGINSLLGTGPIIPGSSCAIGGAVGVTNPATGKMVWFRRAGRPLLWSGDLAACKRVRRAASHARRRVGGR